MWQVSSVHADKADKEAQKFKIGIAATTVFWYLKVYKYN